MSGMPDRERAADRGARRARQDLAAVGAELRTARIMMGATQRDVGRAVGLSYSQIGRIERSTLPSASVEQLARIGAVVGLDVRIRAYPGPVRMRDSGQLAVLGRLRARLAPFLTVRVEVGVPIDGDQRAWDAVIEGFRPAAASLHAEIETRLYDGQAQLRRIALKARDSGVETVFLVVADTPRNRAAVRELAPMIADAYPIAPRTALACLARGEHPGASALVFI
jgi:transcriptional regulator with XRE-family HTH domain